MGKSKVIVSDDRFSGDYGIEREVLAAAGAELEVLKDESDAAFLDAARESDGLLVNLRQIDAEIIRSLPKCRVFSRYGVGYDNIDLAAASKAGIWVANVPDYSTEEVSDQALGLLLACARFLVAKDKALHSGKWNYFGAGRINRIRGTTLGLVGYGNIARRFHRKASGLDFGEVLVCDPLIGEETIGAAGGKKCTLDELVSRADFISVHAPLLPETRHLIGPDQIARMKETAILVNTSRGPLVDEAALAAALEAGRIRAAGLDVFETEPLPMDSPLRKLENVVLTDHCSYYSEEAIRELKEKAALNIAAALAGKKPPYAVNKDILPR